PASRRGRAGRAGPRGAVRLPRRRGAVRRDLLGGDARGGRRAVLGHLLRRSRPVPGPRRPGRPAGDHDAARPDAGHQEHLHLDPEVHLPRRAAPVGHRDRRQPVPHPAADRQTRGLRPALRADAAALARAVRRAGRRGGPPRLRRGVPPDVDLLPELLRSRLPSRLHRRQPAHPGPHMSPVRGQATPKAATPQAATPKAATPPPVAQVIAELLRTFGGQAGLDLPVRLRAWDGSEAGPDDTPVLVVRSPQALRRILWRPGELGLARAYISGDLDVEGDLTEGLRLFFGARPAPRPGPAPQPGPAPR